MGCHSSLGVLADTTFSFKRKMEGNDKSKPDFGWGHWSSKGISGVADRTVKFINFGEQNEYSFIYKTTEQEMNLERMKK